MNNPDFYQFKSHAGNISHVGESKSKDLSEIIEEMNEFAENGFKWN
jgi:hypothetical protein